MPDISNSHLSTIYTTFYFQLHIVMLQNGHHDTYENSNTYKSTQQRKFKLSQGDKHHNSSLSHFISLVRLLCPHFRPSLSSADDDGIKTTRNGDAQCHSPSPCNNQGGGTLQVNPPAE